MDRSFILVYFASDAFWSKTSNRDSQSMVELTREAWRENQFTFAAMIRLPPLDGTTDALSEALSVVQNRGPYAAEWHSNPKVVEAHIDAVRSGRVGDLLLYVNPRGRTRFFVVASFGFDEVTLL